LTLYKFKTDVDTFEELNHVLGLAFLGVVSISKNFVLDGQLVELRILVLESLNTLNLGAEL